MGVTKCPKPKKKHWKQACLVGVKSARATDIMCDLYPYMGIRRKEQIKRAVESYALYGRKLGIQDIIRIKQLVGKGLTHAYIAEKYGIHRTTVTHLVGERGKKRTNAHELSAKKVMDRVSKVING